MNIDLKKAYNLKKLTNFEKSVLINGATEPPFSGKLLHNKKTGKYSCKACGQILFDSGTKFDSNSGWPSFDQAIKGSVTEVADNSLGMNRTEVRCSNCQAHLGHLFVDGPQNTTGLRYCVNSASIDFDSE